VDNKEFTFLGKISRTHGYEGVIVIPLEPGIAKEIEDLESVFVEIDGLPVPFFIGWSSLSSGTLMAQFTDYNSKEKMAALVGNRVYARNIKSPVVNDQSLPLYLVGYTVKNNEGITLGTVIKIASYPMQVMMELGREDGNEILVPLNEEMVVSVDSKNRIIILMLPEGIDTLNS
jgi:16S rRNA processing protein RimM